MNPVLILTHNCLELTKKCVESVRAQTISTWTLAVDNGSTDGTSQWLPDNETGPKDFWAYRFQFNEGVSKGWNWGLNYLFGTMGAEHVLVLNNDVVLPRDFYKALLAYDKPFITGSSVDNMEVIESRNAESGPIKWNEPVPHPDFSAFLISKEAWEKVGPFNESMVHYASDNDWHMRAHRAGITLWNSGFPFYHERSSTLKNASPKEQRLIQLQADADREVFHSIYGCYPWESAYHDLFK